MALNMVKKITIKDVARETGMSLSTVSGVLNGIDKFSEKTKKEVWDVANALNYIPNSQARILRAGGKSQERSMSGIIIHITHMGGETPVGNLFEAQRSQMLAWEAEKLGMFPISYWYHKLKGFQCLQVLNGHIDGAIVGTPHLEVVSVLKGKIPLVLMDVPFSLENADVPMVNIDFRYGFMKLFDHLRSLGHRRIGTISSIKSGEGTSTEIPVLNALLEAARMNNIEVHPECDLRENISPETHFKVMEKAAVQFKKYIVKKEISAIVSPSEPYTKTLHALLTDMDVKIPEDVSLAGMNYDINTPANEITSIVYDWPGLIKTSLEVLKNIIDKKQYHCGNFLVRPNFYEGITIGSCNFLIRNK